MTLSTLNCSLKSSHMKHVHCTKLVYSNVNLRNLRVVWDRLSNSKLLTKWNFVNSHYFLPFSPLKTISITIILPVKFFTLNILQKHFHDAPEELKRLQNPGKQSNMWAISASHGVLNNALQRVAGKPPTESTIIFQQSDVLAIALHRNETPLDHMFCLI